MRGERCRRGRERECEEEKGNVRVGEGRGKDCNDDEQNFLTVFSTTSLKLTDIGADRALCSLEL